MGSRPFGPQAGAAFHSRTCRRAESDRLRSPRISTELEKEIGKGKGTKGQRDELGTGGKPVQAIQDSGQTRPHGERAIFRISETNSNMTPAGPSARIGVHECSAESPFLQVLAQRPRHCPQPTAKERFTASFPAQREARLRQVDFAVIADTQRNHAPRRVSARGR
jgi:hypothetical protein